MSEQGELFSVEPPRDDREKVVEELRRIRHQSEEQDAALQEAVDAREAALPPRERAEAKVARHVDAAAVERAAINAEVSPARAEETGILASDTAAGPLAMEVAREQQAVAQPNALAEELDASAAASRAQMARLREAGVLPPVPPEHIRKLSETGKANLAEAVASSEARQAKRAQFPQRADTTGQAQQWIDAHTPAPEPEAPDEPEDQ